MEFRILGRSGLKVPVLSLGTGTFGGANEFFRAWGDTGVEEATRLVDICLEAGLNMFDTADIYSDGESEKVLGAAIAGRRDKSPNLHESHIQNRLRPQQSRLLPLSSNPGLRSQPPPPKN